MRFGPKSTKPAAMFSQQVTSVSAHGTTRTQASGIPNRMSRRFAAVKTGIAKSMPIGSIQGCVKPQRSAASETELNEEARPRPPTPAPHGGDRAEEYPLAPCERREVRRRRGARVGLVHAAFLDHRARVFTARFFSGTALISCSA